MALNSHGDTSPSQFELALNVIDCFNELSVASGGSELMEYMLIIAKDGEPYGDYVVARRDRPAQWEHVSDLEDMMAAELRWRLRLI